MASAGPYRLRHPSPQPQRRVLPLSLRTAMVLGNMWALAAWALLLATSLLAWHVAANSPLVRATISGSRETTWGLADGVDVGPVFGGPDTRDVHYHFTTLDGRTFRGTSYHGGARDQAGVSYEIEYQTDDPRRSRIVGLRETQYSGWIVAMAGVPGLIALGLFVTGWWHERRRIRLLTHGRVATSASVCRYQTSGRSLFRFVSHSYDDERGNQHTCTARVYRDYDEPVGASAQVIYPPLDHALALAVETLPGRPNLVGDELRPGPWPRHILVLILILVIVNLVCAVSGGIPLVDPLGWG